MASSSAKSSEVAERRRSALRAVLGKNNLSPVDAARAAGLVSANALYNFLNGRSNSISSTTYEKLSKVIPGASIDLLSGTAPRKVEEAKLGGSVSVLTFTSAGDWRSSGELPLNKRYDVMAPLKQEHIDAHVFGVEVRCPGSERLYPDGTTLLVVPPEYCRSPLNHGDHIILQRMVNKRVEVTVRELVVRGGDEAWAWPRSTHPQHQAPMYVPWPFKAQSWRTHEETVRVVGVVLGAITTERPI